MHSQTHTFTFWFVCKYAVKSVSVFKTETMSFKERSCSTQAQAEHEVYMLPSSKKELALVSNMITPVCDFCICEVMDLLARQSVGKDIFTRFFRPDIEPNCL